MKSPIEVNSAKHDKSDKHDNRVRQRCQGLIKSPSDTTLYSPGLCKVNQIDSEINTIDKISNFVDTMRINTDTNVRSVQRQSPSTQRNTSQDRHRIETSNIQQEDTRDTEREATESATSQLLLQAERFKARVEAPKGMNSIMPYDYEKLRTKFITANGLAPIDSEIMFLRNFDQDDEFFHITSQIEPSLKSKIERGEFIDLERLLPKDKFSSSIRGGSEELNRQLFQLIAQGTNSYLSPPDPRGNGNKINNIKKWDQAFRVFAAIYTQANPNRSSEVW